MDINELKKYHENILQYLLIKGEKFGIRSFKKEYYNEGLWFDGPPSRKNKYISLTFWDCDDCKNTSTKIINYDIYLNSYKSTLYLAINKKDKDFNLKKELFDKIANQINLKSRESEKTYYWEKFYEFGDGSDNTENIYAAIDGFLVGDKILVDDIIYKANKEFITKTSADIFQENLNCLNNKRKDLKLKQILIKDNNFIKFDSYEKELEHANSLTPNDRLNIIKNSNDYPEVTEVTKKEYKRSAYIVVETLCRAKGVCECCGMKAPFFRDSNSEPFLEVHHVIPLSDIRRGKDTLDNTVAICPNCHREAHYGENKRDIEEKLKKICTQHCV